MNHLYGHLIYFDWNLTCLHTKIFMKLLAVLIKTVVSLIDEYSDFHLI